MAIKFLLPGDTIILGDPYEEHVSWEVIERTATTITCEEQDVTPHPDPGPLARHKIPVSDRPIHTLDPRITRVFF